MSTLRSLSLTVVLLLALVGPAFAEEPRAVVKAFYDAYMAKGERMDLRVFIREQKSRFEPALAALLQDIADNDPGQDEAWLDFDPFINAQMNAASLTVGSAKVSNGLANVPVSVSYRTPGHEMLAVKVVLRPSGDTWRIANFVYPARDGMEAWDLKSWLQKQLGK